MQKYAKINMFWQSILWLFQLWQSIQFWPSIWCIFCPNNLPPLSPSSSCLSVDPELHAFVAFYYQQPTIGKLSALRTRYPSLPLNIFHQIQIQSMLSAVHQFGNKERVTVNFPQHLLDLWPQRERDRRTHTWLLYLWPEKSHKLVYRYLYLWPEN